MSYPPPGGGYPDPYQQPPQSGPPAYGQPPPPPGYGPPPGPPGGPPPGFPPQPGQPGPPPQGFLPPQQPKKSKTGLILGLVLGGVFFLVIIVVVLMLLFGGGGGAASPKAAVESYVSAAESGDTSTLESLSCEADKSASSGDAADVPQEFSEAAEDIDISWEVGEENLSGDSATVDVKMTVTYQGQTNENTIPVAVVEEDGWKVCMSETDFSGGYY